MPDIIDSIRVNGQDYTFTLAPDTDLEINSLTVTGTLTADTITASTANLSVISSALIGNPFNMSVITIQNTFTAGHITLTTNVYNGYVETTNLLPIKTSSSTYANLGSSSRP